MDINDFDILILGYSGYVESVEDVLSDIDELKDENSVVQLINADLIAGSGHVCHAINQAVLAFNRKRNFANDLGVEICLRCSAQKQISKAFQLLGLKEGEMNICSIILNPNDSILEYLNNTFTRDDGVLSNINPNLIEAFDISSEEAESYMYEDIIIDKISKISVDY